MLLPFELDPQIIHHIIYSQAGSIGKAIIELLMNSVDASATRVVLVMTREGFSCIDDGNGFASRDDVVRYFGRFGTPHEEGDATYGRFRLGRGQIMAHASTEWTSNRWKMTVDTRTMGYNYELTELDGLTTGCEIAGRWYEPLTDSELMSAVQEVRDLVRYTPVSVELNGRTITRDPKAERWDAEDEFAYYRVKAEGAVSIYNQGVMVRHDSSHLWGVGGLIVSKKAIGLNVSRTEILRKTCPVWKAIARQFGKMAEQMATRLGDHRKTEARREKSARALLSGDPDLLKIHEKEEVVTLLPGKRHVTLSKFLHDAMYRFKGNITVVENAFDVPKGEAIARERIALVVHPQTIERFGCYSPEDWREALELAITNVSRALEGRQHSSYYSRCLAVPAFTAFSVLRKSFVERTRVVTEKDCLDKETKRAWIALRWCLHQYAGLCAGGQITRRGRLWWDDKNNFKILLGESNAAEAWTDGKTYIAINERVVKRLKTDPLKTANYIFSLVDHEVAHQGDSIDCGHDEAFYERYHDISIRVSPERQRYIHMWLMKYTYSMENEGKPKAGWEAWAERRLLDRVGKGRQKRGLSPVAEDLSGDAAMAFVESPASEDFIANINAGLVLGGKCPPPPNWDEVIERAAREHQRVAAEQREAASREREDRREMEQVWEQEAELEAERLAACRARVAAVLGIAGEDLPDAAIDYILHCTSETESEIRSVWETREWEGTLDEPPDDYDPLLDDVNDIAAEADSGDLSGRVDASLLPFVQEGENWWSLERNAASAGFFKVDDYLRWRAAEAGGAAP